MLRSLLALVLLATAASAQPSDTLTVRPGDASLVTDWMADGTQTLTLKLVQPMQQDIGSGTTTYTLSQGRVAKTTVLSIPMQGVTQTDSVTAMAGALAPLTHTSTGGRAETSLEFLDEGIVGLVTPRTGEAETVLVMTDAPVFDAAWLTEVIQSLPFAEGYVAKIPVYSAEMGDEPVDIVVSVVGQETVGERDGWTVEAAMGPMTMTHVVDAETRALLVTRLSPQPGVAIEMVPGD